LILLSLLFDERHATCALLVSAPSSVSGRAGPRERRVTRRLPIGHHPGGVNVCGLADEVLDRPHLIGQ
jgi:hypothetical protein